jgi:flagellar motor switch protein FliM
MERVLNQEEIDAMVQAARGRHNKPGRGQRSIRPCSFRQSGQLTGEEARAVTGLHETFARSLSQSLGAYLRVLFEANLVSVEQLSYGEFLGRVPEVTYMISLQVPQLDATAALQLDHSLVFPLVDILLGGIGKCETMTREISEIEDQIMEGVARIICHELTAAWAAFGGAIELGQRQPPAQMQRFLSPTEKTLCLSFEVKLAEARGMLNLVFPMSISNTMMRKLSSDWSYGKSRHSTRIGKKLAAKMLDCSFPLTLGVSTIKLAVQTLLTLTPDDVCNLGVPVRSPAALIIAGRPTFEANPVRHGRQRAAQIVERIVIREERHE